MSKKDIRDNFRNEVFKRDNFSCKMCGVKGNEETLDAHHITDRNEMPNGGYVKENGITLCKSICHLKAEKFHITNGNEFELNFHPKDLYEKINSNYEKAFKKSEMIKKQ